MSPRSSKRVKMKTVNKIKEKKHKTIKKPKVKPKKEKVLIVAQEIKFARLLSGNEKKTRDRVLKTFKKWLLNCFSKGYEFKEDDFTRVWKGLFYAVWMSDKPLVQEDLCETISGILDLFPPEHIKSALLMTKAGFKVLATEWFGIDQHRMDKFLMLVRRYLRGSLRCLKRCEWSEHSCDLYADMLSGKDGILATTTPMYARNAASMRLHIIDCFLEELSKVSSGAIAVASLLRPFVSYICKGYCTPLAVHARRLQAALLRQNEVSSGAIPSPAVAALLRPFVLYICKGDCTPLAVHARRLLTALLRQSEKGLEYNERTKAWEMMGCPRGGPDALEPASDDDDDEHNPSDGDDDDDDQQSAERPLDPRAGRVDVELTPLPVPAQLIANMLKEVLVTASSKAHKRTKICLQRFEQLAKDEYPLTVPDVYTEDIVSRPRPSHAAKELKALDAALVEGSDELALRGLSRKHRKRLLARARAGHSIVEEVQATKGDSSNASTNGNWEVESTEPAEKKTNKQQTDSSNKENVHKDKKTKKRKQTNTETDSKSKKTKSNEENQGTKETSSKDQVSKKSYEKKTKSNNKKHKLLKNDKLQNKLVNGTHENNEVNNKKDKPQADKQSSIEKHKKPKETSLTKQNDKNAKKKPIQETKTEKVLTKSNKHNETKDSSKKPDHKQQKNVENHKQEKKTPSLVVNKVKNYQKKTSADKQNSPQKKVSYETPKKVKFVLKNNSMQGTIDYYKSVRQSPNIPFDSSKKPTKTNLKVSTPSPINPFFKKKLRIK